MGQLRSTWTSRSDRALGLTPPNLTQEIYDWLKENFTFGKLQDWGYDNAASPADIAANESGFQFWKDLASWKKDDKFDICKYVNDKWDEIKNPSKPVDPKPAGP